VGKWASEVLKTSEALLFSAALGAVVESDDKSFFEQVMRKIDQDIAVNQGNLLDIFIPEDFRTRQNHRASFINFFVFSLHEAQFRATSAESGDDKLINRIFASGFGLQLL
jgi:hypothetical protein